MFTPYFLTLSIDIIFLNDLSLYIHDYIQQQHHDLYNTEHITV